MTGRYFALIPAAGHSTRMRGAKLLLPLNGQPLILHTIAAWQRSRADRVVIVMRPDDQALRDLVEKSKAQSPRSKVLEVPTLDVGSWTLDSAQDIELVIPEISPPDMKASLQAALRHIEGQHSPTPDDAFLVAPADMPRLSPAIVDRLISHHAASSERKILAPTLGGRRGHPVLFPWHFASEVHALPAGEGLNAIVRRHLPMLLPCEDLIGESEYPFADIDTPEDYERITNGR